MKLRKHHKKQSEELAASSLVNKTSHCGDYK